jgi:hypothetical protein
MGWPGKGGETTGSLLSCLSFQPLESPEGQLRSSGDTIPNCLGELGEIRERTGIPADGPPAGTSGAPGVERLRPREQMVNGRAAASGEKRIDFSVGSARFGAILKERGRSSRSGPVWSLPIRLSVAGSSQRGRFCARPHPAGLAWSVGHEAGEQWPGDGGDHPRFPGAKKAG